MSQATIEKLLTNTGLKLISHFTQNKLGNSIGSKNKYIGCPGINSKHWFEINLLYTQKN